MIMVKMTLSDGQILTQNFDFIGQISTFCAENTPRSEPFKTENNTQTTNDPLRRPNFDIKFWFSMSNIDLSENTTKSQFFDA